MCTVQVKFVLLNTRLNELNMNAFDYFPSVFLQIASHFNIASKNILNVAIRDSSKHLYEKSGPLQLN